MPGLDLGQGHEACLGVAADHKLESLGDGVPADQFGLQGLPVIQVLQNLLCSKTVGSGFRVGKGQPRKRLAGKIVFGIAKGGDRGAPQRQFAPGVGEAGARNARLFFLNQCRSQSVCGHENIKRGAVFDLGVKLARGAVAC